MTSDIKGFDEWLDEIEIFSLRRERFQDDVYQCDVKTMTEWLKAAWIMGANDLKLKDVRDNP